MADLTGRLTACKLLVIEDDRTNAAMLRHHLQGAGYNNLTFAENGEQGLKLTAETMPDLVLLDMMMPQMNGFEYCRAVQQNEKFAHIPIIVQTSLEANEDKIRAFSVGSSDYVTKRADASELLARIKVHLTNKILREDILAQQQKMHTELGAAQLMQANLMPSNTQIEMIERVYHLGIARHFETSSIMGGDFWGTHPLTETRLAIYILDFSGHGIASAMNVFRMHTLMQELAAEGNSAGHFLSILNRHLYPLIERSEFATMFYGIVDIKSGQIEYATAAAPPALLVRPGAEFWLESAGFPLGATPDATYTTLRAPFSVGDALVIFSDCFIESANHEQQVISEETIANCAAAAFANQADKSAAHIMESLLACFRQHSPGAVADDLTLNVYYRK